jgi:alpha-L-fucosidase
MIRKFGDGRDWFFDKRFGMFVHWGLYAIPAWHEQILWRGKFKRKDYEKLVHEFNPVHYEPERWLDAMQGAGMEYLCFTTKHHDGFCMWDTAFTDYKVTNTPYRRDVLAMLAEACKRRGILLGLYYSLPDWHHPSYPNKGRHHEMLGPRDGDAPDEGRYLEYVRAQVRELLTGYGPIHEMFWDVNVAGFSDPSFNAMVRELQPDCLINDRGPSPGDYSTPERHVPEGRVFDKLTEANQAMGRESWGYREDEDYYSVKFLESSIDRILAMGGNYLLNVGPRADGTFPRECVDGLARIGRWYAKVREAFAGTDPCSYMLTSGDTTLFRYDEVLLTRRGNTLYVHCPHDLQTSTIVLPGIDVMPRDAVLLNDGRPLRCVVDTIPWRWREKPCLRVTGLPVDEITGETLVARLELDPAVAE